METVRNKNSKMVHACSQIAQFWPQMLCGWNIYLKAEFFDDSTVPVTCKLCLKRLKRGSERVGFWAGKP